MIRFQERVADAPRSQPHQTNPNQRRSALLPRGGECAIFLGDRRDIPAVLASMDIAVLTSDSDSLSNVIIEAMAASLPVVAYDVGGNAELINEQRGALVTAGNEHEFAIAILRLLSDASLRERQGRTSRQFAEENFGIDRVRCQYEDLYTRLVRQKG